MVTGVVTSTPRARGDMLEFRFTNLERNPYFRTKKTHFLVRWYRDWPVMEPGEEWELMLKLKPARSRLNLHGPDRERRYFSEAISALAIVDSPGSHRVAPGSRHSIAGLRQRTRESITDILDEHPARPLILALSLADRGEIPEQQWSRFRKTGTSHLLAISGMHIGLAAVLGFWLGRSLLLLAPVKLILKRGLVIAWCFSIGLAAWYGLMAGLGTSTRRALIMLVTFAVVSLCKRNTGPWQGYQIALLVVLVLNPLSPLGAGFWFSFSAVAVLLAVFSTRHGQQHWIGSMILAQSGLLIAMIPMGMFWFQQFTFLGLISNILAIPWISFAVVPASILAVLFMPLESWLTPFLLFLSAESALWLLYFLEWLEKVGNAGWIETWKPGFVVTVVATLGGLLLLLPRGISFRYLGILMIIPLAVPPKRPAGQLRIEMLDVGQGLAVLVETSDHLLLYDSGPGDGSSWSLVPSAIIPAIANTRASTPDVAIISHGDLDHAGGLFELQARYPDMKVISSPGQPGTVIEDCRAPGNWIWEPVGFSILHPRNGLPYLGNNSSCVLSISFDGQRILMTGDIGISVEQRLLAQGIKPHQLLFAAHHGSKSSSGPAFLNAVNPDVALVSAGFRNRFDFPHESVTDRFRALEVPVWNTADCGGIEITLQTGRKPVAGSARRIRSAIWRWPAKADCP